MSERNLSEVIDKIMVVLPADQGELREHLRHVQKSCGFAPPEGQFIWWKRATALLRTYVGEPNTEWKVRIADIFNGPTVAKTLERLDAAADKAATDAMEGLTEKERDLVRRRVLQADPTLAGLLRLGRSIWGEQRLSLPEIVVRLGVGFGDLARLARDGEPKGVIHAHEAEKRDAWRHELKKELGNVIFSTIRWCDDLGFTPDECIRAAAEAQVAFAGSNKPR